MFDDDFVQKSPGVNYLRLAFNIVLIVVSSLASFSFFYQYAPGLLTAVLPASLASVGAGIIGVLITEGALLWWTHMNHNDARTEEQLSVSHAGYIFSMITSVGTTGFYFVLSSSLISPFMTDQFHNIVSFGALLLLILSIVVQLVLNREYNRNSSVGKRAAAAARVAAKRFHAFTAMDNKYTNAELVKMIEEATAQMSKHASSYGKAKSREMIEARQVGTDTDASVNPTQGRERINVNGRK